MTPYEQYAVAIRLLNGDGVVQDERAGYELMVEAARGGIVDAAYEAGQCLRLGRGTGVDRRLAYGFYRMAAEAGHGQSAFSAAILMTQGAVGEPDLVGAVGLYALGVAAGHPGAAHNLGVMHVKGVGVEADAARARDFLTLAVDWGFDQALFSLGLLCLLGGPNLKPDPVEALKWALISQSRDPGGPGGNLAQRAAAALDERGRAEARKRSQAWTAAKA